jgi:hypothetical protein
MLILGALLILLHGPDDHIILISPDQVTSLREAKPGEEGRHFTDTVHCMVNTTDGKFVTVVEPCSTVRTLMERSK